MLNGVRMSEKMNTVTGERLLLLGRHDRDVMLIDGIKEEISLQHK